MLNTKHSGPGQGLESQLRELFSRQAIGELQKAVSLVASTHPSFWVARLALPSDPSLKSTKKVGVCKAP